MALSSGDTLEDLKVAALIGSGGPFETVLDAKAGETWRISAGLPNGDAAAYDVWYLDGKLAWGETPGNDERARAVAISGTSGSVSGSTRFATRAAGEGKAGLGRSTLWWTYESDASGWVRFAVDGDSEDWVVTVHREAADEPGGLKVVTSSTFLESGGQVDVVFRAEEGVRYTISLGVAGAGDGEFELSWEETDEPVWLHYAGRLTDGERDSRGDPVEIRNPSAIAINASGTALYLASELGLQVFERDPATGGLAFVQLLDTGPYLEHARLIWDQGRDRLLVEECGVWGAFAPVAEGRELEDLGELEVADDPGTCAHDLLVDASGADFYRIGRKNVIEHFAFDDAGGLYFAEAIEFDESDGDVAVGVLSNGGGHLYVMTGWNLKVFARSLESGALTNVDVDIEASFWRTFLHGAPSDRLPLAITEDDRYLFVFDYAGQSTNVFSLDDPAEPDRLATLEFWQAPFESNFCRFADTRSEIVAVDVFCPGLAFAAKWDPEIRVLARTDYVVSGEPDEAGRSLPQFDELRGLAAAPDDRHLYVATAQQGVLTFGRGAGYETTTLEDSGVRDLMVQRVWSTPASPAAESTFRLSALVRNTGAGRSTGATLRFRRSDDAEISAADSEVGSAPVGILDPSGTRSRSVDVEAPSDPGSYYYGACVGSSGEDECSEAVRVTVAEPLPGSPDLIVAVSVDPIAVGPEDSVTVSAVVANVGDRRSSATTVRYYRSDNATVSSGDAEVGSAAVRRMLAGWSTGSSVSATVPSDGGTYYYGACVDRVDGEVRTGNNCSEGVAVQVAGPDDHGDATADATSVSVRSTTDGEIEEAGDLDYFRFEAVQRGTLTVETTGSTDTLGTLFGEDGEELASDDDSGADGNFLIQADVDAGVHYVEVRGADRSTGRYTLSIGFEAARAVAFSAERIITADADRPYDVHAADLDGDGDVDVVAASYGDPRIAWHQNLGGGEFTAAQTISDDVVGPRSVHAADLDGDGDADLLSASVDDKIAWYENLGDDFAAQRIITDEAGSARSVHAADFDGDGDADVLSGGGDGTIAWYENLGDDFSAQRVVSTDAGIVEAVLAADLDGDGDADVVYNEGRHKIAWQENLGGNFSERRTITAVADATQSLHAADVDGDGDADVLSASANDDKVAWYENLGDGAFSAQRVVATDADGADSVFAADLDRDGDADVLSASSNDYEIAWHENRGDAFGSRQVIATHDRTNVASGATSVFGAGLDGDGDVDALASSFKRSGKIAWYENLSDHGDDHGDDPQRATLATALPAFLHGVIESSGDRDVFRVATGSGTLRVYSNGPTDTFGALLNAAGLQSASNDDGGDSANFLIEAEVDAGVHYVQVRGFGNATGLYTLSIEFLAGPDMIASPGTEVILGSGVVLDCAAAGAGYEWSQVGGTEVSFDTSGEAPRFVVPGGATTSLEFRVEATGCGNQPLSDIVTIGVVPARVERVLSALVDFEDVDPANRPFSRAALTGLLADDDDSLAGYFTAASRGLVDVRFEVLDWVTVGKERDDYTLGDDRDLIQDVVDRLSEVADLGRYDKVFPAIFPLEDGGPGCAAYLEPINFRTSKGTFRLGAAWLSGYDMGCVAKGRHAHEFGHTFGFVHSLQLDCHTETGIPVSTVDPAVRDSCRIVTRCLNDDCTEIGDGDVPGFILNNDPDMMGNDRPSLYEDYFPLVYHAVWQAHAGWLTKQQIVTKTGKHWITSLESLSPTPKAIRIRLGRDHHGGVQAYWLEAREPLPDTQYLSRTLESCSIAVRLTSPNLYSKGERRRGWGDSAYTDTLRFVWHPGEYPTFRSIRDGEPFWDPYRGVRFELAECRELDHEVAVRVDVARSELKAKPSVVAVLERGKTEITVTNTGVRPVIMRQPSIGGSHAGAFTLGSEDCSGAELRSGQSCRIEVESGAVSESVAFLQIPNDDYLAPKLTVSLVARPESTAIGVGVPLRLDHGADHLTQ